MLFLIPGTPKDFLTYFVGLTDMPVILWFLITFIGRFPSILLSSMSGGALESRNYAAAVKIWRDQKRAARIKIRKDSMHQ